MARRETRSADRAVRVGIFGGSFNPPHICHVFACAFALGTEEVDEVWVVPCYRHPFGKDLAPFAHRVRMLRLAMRPFGVRVKVCTIEKTLADPSFTYHTVRRLQEIHPGRRWRLVVGTDIVHETPRWHRFPELAGMAPLLLVPRQPPGKPGKEAPFGLPGVSSSLLRKLLARGEDPGPLLPRAVHRYLRENALYREGGPR